MKLSLNVFSIFTQIKYFEMFTDIHFQLAFFSININKVVFVGSKSMNISYKTIYIYIFTMVVEKNIKKSQFFFISMKFKF